MRKMLENGDLGILIKNNKITNSLVNHVCSLCGEEIKHQFKWSGFNIFKCIGCSSACVAPMPSAETLNDFYSGFLFSADIKNRNRILTPALNAYFGRIVGPANENKKMLDVGGGGGFFSLAFEKFGYGDSLYLDLDQDACNFASSLGLTKVKNGRIEDFAGLGSDKFDLIYLRHVAEHLINPVFVIKALLDRLRPGGTLVLHIPNGQAMEQFFLFPEFGWKWVYRLNKNMPEKGLIWAFFKTLLGGLPFGIDPPRHLWAFTAQGLTSAIDSKGFQRKVYVRSVADLLFSPYYTAGNPLSGLRNIVARQLGRHRLFGSHLIIEYKKMED